MLLVSFWCFTVYLSVRFGYTVSTLWLIIVRKLRYITKIKTGSGVPRWWGMQPCATVLPTHSTESDKSRRQLRRLLSDSESDPVAMHAHFSAGHVTLESHLQSQLT
jgi:hypothetical protein